MDKDLIKQVAKALGESTAMVTKTIDHYEQYIVDVIKKGEYENIRVPQLGRFEVNMKKLKYLIDASTMPKSKVVKRQKKTL
jgi:nucleoid DNA-binding protein